MPSKRLVNLAFSLVYLAWSYLSAKLERLMKPRFYRNQSKIEQHYITKAINETMKDWRYEREV
jgi:hypothetical protein